MNALRTWLTGRAFGLVPRSSYLALLVAVTALVVLELHHSYVAAQRQAQEASGAIALSIATSLANTLTAVDHVLGVLQQEVPAGSLLADFTRNPQELHQFNRLLTHLQGSIALITGIRVFNSRGERLYSSVQGEAFFSIADRPYFEQLRDDAGRQTHYSEILIGRISNRPVVVAYRALRSASGEFLGTAQVAIDQGHLQELLNRLSTDSRGRVIIRRLDNQALVAGFPAGPDTDNTSIHAHHPVGDFGFQVEVCQTRAEYLASWYTKLYVYLVSALVLAAILVMTRRLHERQAVHLSASEARFQASFDASPVPMAVIQDEHLVLHLNPALVQTLGYTLQDVPTLEAWRRRVYPDETYRTWVLQAWRQRTAQAQASDGHFRPLELTLHSASGRTLSMLASSTMLAAPAQNLRLITLYDITERKQAEQALAALTHRYQLLFEKSPDAYLLISVPEGRVVDCNQAFEQMLGGQREQLIGLSLTQLSPAQQPDGSDSLAAGKLHFTRVQTQGQHHFEWMHCQLDGRSFWASVGASLIEIEKQPFILAVWRDISLTKQLEAELREEIEKNHVIANNASDGLCILDETGRAVEVNDAFCRHLGCTRQEVLAMSVPDWDPLYDPIRIRSVIDTQIAAGGQIILETQHRIRNGQLRDVEITSRPFQYKGQQLVFTAVRDITQRKQLEQELAEHREHLEQLVQRRTLELAIARDAAESANKAKSAFLSMVSHELRTPLSGIMGTLALAQRRTQDSALLNYLGIAERSSHHLLSLIQDLLEISRIEADRMEIEDSDFQLPTLLREVHDSVAEPAKAKNLELALNLPDELAQRHFRGDARRLAQVLINLVGNAIKFTTQGSIRVDVSCLADDNRALPARLRFAVVDTGIGITVKDQRRIFEPFEQVDSSSTRRFGGTGLGLFISQKLVRAMGGELRVQSQVGVGSIFWFEVPALPARLAPATAPQLPAEVDPGEQLRREFPGARLLLVEDEPINQAVTQELLQSQGLEVEVADDGEQAVAVCRASSQASDGAPSSTVFALILMDLNMRHMGGVEATRQIRSLPGYQHLPIIALTANAFDEDRQACLQAGMNDHLGKPVMAQELYARVLAWLRKAAQISGANA